MQKNASRTDATLDFMLFHSYYTCGDKHETLARRNTLRSADSKLFQALLNFINAPCGDDDVSRQKRLNASKDYLDAFRAMKERTAKKPAVAAEGQQTAAG